LTVGVKLRDRVTEYREKGASTDGENTEWLYKVTSGLGEVSKD
jgi:hypothetical protein